MGGGILECNQIQRACGTRYDKEARWHSGCCDCPRSMCSGHGNGALRQELHLGVFTPGRGPWRI
jgi:hypothetical protein